MISWEKRSICGMGSAVGLVWDIGKQVTYPENDYSITVSVSVNACLHASTDVQWLCVCVWGGGAI